MHIAVKATKTIGIAATLLLAVACSKSSESPASSHIRPGKIVVEVAENFAPLTVNTIAILPLSFSATLSSQQLDENNGLDAALQRTVAQHTSYEIVSVQVEASTFGDEVVARKVAAANDLQGVLFGTVNDYQVKKRNEYTEATVDFSLSLYDKTSGAVVWRARYQDKFEPLSDNLLQLPRALSQKFQAPSSLELATDGFLRAAQDLEKRRSR